MSHVFVSYSRKNSELMVKITSELRAKGVNIWVDRTGLKPGDSDWQENIQNAIEQAACMVVLLSPEAKLSKWVKKEFQYADVRERRIYPLLISGKESDAIPIGLIGAQFVDLRENFDQKIDELVSDLAQQYPDTISDIDFLSTVFISANGPKVISNILDLLSPEERARLEDRLLVLNALTEGKSYREIEGELGVGTYLISRVKRLLGEKWLTDVQDLLRKLPRRK